MIVVMVIVVAMGIVMIMMFIFLCLSACGGALQKMDRMKIIKRRLSMSLRSARPVDDSLSELAEQMTLNEPAKDNGERSPLP